MPLLIFLTLYKNRNNLKDRLLVLRRCGYLFMSYKNSCYYWEFVKILQRVLIVVVLSFYKDSTTLNLLIIQIILIIYLFIIQNQQPYIYNMLNSLDQYCTKLTILVFWLALFSDNVSNSTFKSGILVVIILLIIFLVLSILVIAIEPIVQS